MNQQQRPHTVRAALLWAVSCLERHGLQEKRLDTELLLAHTLGLERFELFVEPLRVLPELEWLEFARLVERKVAREPVQYILGKQEFMALEFAVNPAVLIPRPDTEVLVETALDWAKSQTEQLRILDICTGSGAIAVSLAHYLPKAEVWAGDISFQALEVARSNAVACGAVVNFVQGDLVEPVLGKKFQMITANPPYIPSAVICTLEEEVSKGEPRLALDGGADGLDFYRRLAVEMPSVLQEGGKILLEIGWDQGPDVLDLLARAGFSGLEIIRDLAGRDRVIAGYGPMCTNI